MKDYKYCNILAILYFIWSNVTENPFSVKVGTAFLGGIFMIVGLVQLVRDK